MNVRGQLHPGLPFRHVPFLANLQILRVHHSSHSESQVLAEAEVEAWVSTRSPNPLTRVSACAAIVTCIASNPPLHRLQSSGVSPLFCIASPRSALVCCNCWCAAIVSCIASPDRHSTRRVCVYDFSTFFLVGL